MFNIRKQFFLICPTLKLNNIFSIIDIDKILTYMNRSDKVVFKKIIFLKNFLQSLSSLFYTPSKNVDFSDSGGP